MTIKVKNHLSYRFMPMIILSYLFINLYLIMIGSSWCSSQGCEISKELLTIGQTDLYYLAIGAFGVLLITGLKILKTDSIKLKEFYKFSVFTIMICETILLSYLYFKSGTLCWSCFVFYLLVIANYLLIDIKSTKVFVIPFIVASFALIDLDSSNPSNESLSQKYTLLQSPSCKHCIEVKEYLKDNSINYKQEDYINYNGLFSSLNITKIPVLLVKKNDNNIIILNGVSEIIEYFNNNKENETLPVISHNSVKTKSFTLNMEEDGCGVNYLKKELENCEK